MSSPHAETLSFLSTLYAPRTVVVAFESDVTRARLSSELRKGGYHVIEERDGLELMHYLEDALKPPVPCPVPDAIIADADLYGFSGIEVCWTLREFDVEIPFLLVLREEDEVHHKEADDAGASYVATEPVNAGALKDVLSRMWSA